MNLYLILLRGESRTISLTVMDSSTGLAVDLSSGIWQVSTVEWQMKTILGGTDPGGLLKSLGAGIALRSPQTGDNKGMLDITLDPSDTASRALGGYMHDCVATFVAGLRLYLIKPSGVSLLDVVNQL